jgi:hypothetical protein
LPFWLTVFTVAVIYLSLFRYIQTINWSGYQGRLGFAAASPIAALLALGLSRLGGERVATMAAGLLASLATAMVALVIAPAYSAASVYQPGVAVPGGDVLASWPCARYAIGFDLERAMAAAEVKPGDRLSVAVSGFAWHAPIEAYQIRAEVIGPDGVAVGRASAAWTGAAGSTITATLDISIAPGATPGRASLRVGLSDSDGAWLPATSPSARALPSPPAVATIKLAPAQPVLAAPQQRLRATFGDNIALIGYDLVQEGERWRLTLYWQAEARMTEDYTRFAHLLGPDGQLLGQADGQPQNGYYPTSIWSAGETVIDTLWLEPGVEPAGELNLAVGFYAQPSLQRLPVTDAGGQRLPDDALIVPIPAANRP